MTDIIITSLTQFFGLVPTIIIIVIVFDFLGTFFFGK